MAECSESTGTISAPAAAASRITSSPAQTSLKTLQAEQQRLLEEQQRLYDERAKLKKEARMIDTLKANVDDFLKPNAERDQEHQRNSQRE